MTTLFFILIIAVAAFLFGWSLGLKEGQKQSNDIVRALLAKIPVQKSEEPKR